MHHVGWIVVVLLRQGSAIFAISAANHHARDHVYLSLLNGFRKAVKHLLSDLVLRAAAGGHLFFDRDRLNDTGAGNPLSIGLGQNPDLGWPFSRYAPPGR